MMVFCRGCFRTTEGPLYNGLCAQCVETLGAVMKHGIEIDRQRDIMLMTHPEHWQFKPFLPLVKRRKEFENVGFLYLSPKGASAVQLMPTVYLGTFIINERIGDRFEETTGVPSFLLRKLRHEEVMELTTLNYRTFTELSYDGWEVDRGTKT